MGFFDFLSGKKHSQPAAYECPFYIRSSTHPETEGFDVLNHEEEIFFAELERQLIAAKISPSSISLTRLSSGMFNVDHTKCYVGKIGLRPESVPDKYAVWKKNGRRALRIFESKQEAEQYKLEKNADEIEFRPGYTGTFFMQYFRTISTSKEIHTEDIQECINAIPFWVMYIKRYGH